MAYIGAPKLGSAGGGYPDLFQFSVFFPFVPICFRDLFRIVLISPFPSDLFRFALLVFGDAPICSDLLRKKQVRETLPTPFCKSPITGVSREFLARVRKGQRAENGGLDPSWLNFAFLGRPDFQSKDPF